jgi:hypothetical protein
MNPTADEIRAMAKARGCCSEDLLAMSPQVDPFMADQPRKRTAAEWFARLWDDYDFPAGTHLRRAHYVLASAKSPPVLPDGAAPRRNGMGVRKGMPYLNTDFCWNYLQDASAYARHLGLVRADAFADRRNPDPHLFLDYNLLPSPPGCEMEEFPDWGWPFVRRDLTAYLHFPLPRPLVTGYDYDQTSQPYHLELWIEKSTMNDVLVPLCRELGINLVTSVGFQSITAAVKLLKRAALVHRVAGGKPVRVFWVSDFDPAGDKMPPALSRQLEFYRDKYAPGAEVKVHALALTQGQVRGYDLPRIPIKEGDRRKGDFEDRRGEGAVELDALEALHPGSLARIVREAVSPYRDETLPARLEEVGQEAQDRAEEEWEGETEALRGRLAEIEEEAGKVCERYQKRLAKIDTELQRELGPLKARLDEVRHALLAAAQSFSPAVLPRPEADPEVPDESGWLYDSARDYLEQLAAYRRHKGNGA